MIKSLINVDNLYPLQCFGNVNSQTLAKQVFELGLIIGIIIGRWLLPRGEITRDQLSALLLGYVGTAADILELFEVLEEQAVRAERQVTFAVLSVYSWSLLQFCLVTTATTGKNNQIRITNNKVCHLPTPVVMHMSSKNSPLSFKVSFAGWFY